MRARHDILLENYSKAIQLEGRTMAEMMHKDFLPALLAHTADTARAVREKESPGTLHRLRPEALKNPGGPL